MVCNTESPDSGAPSPPPPESSNITRIGTVPLSSTLVQPSSLLAALMSRLRDYPPGMALVQKDDPPALVPPLIPSLRMQPEISRSDPGPLWQQRATCLMLTYPSGFRYLIAPPLITLREWKIWLAKHPDDLQSNFKALVEWVAGTQLPLTPYTFYKLESACLYVALEYSDLIMEWHRRQLL